MFRYEIFVVQVISDMEIIVDIHVEPGVYWSSKVKKVMKNLKQNLVGKRVQGTYCGFKYVGTIVESAQTGEDFNHVIQFDEELYLSPKQLGYPRQLWGYKAQVYRGVNWDTSVAVDSLLTMTVLN